MRSATRLAVTACLAAAAWSPVAGACGPDPFIGEVCLFPYNFAPRGYAFTDGSLLPIAQNTALFSLLGTTYGGNGTTTFALPDTRGRVIIGAGQGPGLSPYMLGQMGGSENVTLTTNQMPTHSHPAATSVVAKAVGANTEGNVDNPAASAWAAKSRGGPYSATAPNVEMAAGTVQVTSATTTVGISGGGQPFAIVQPFVVLNPAIALNGTFPSRN